jgi:GTPase-associated system helical domain
VSEDVLLRFLSNGLIDVGGDDAKLEKLQSTASDLAEALRKAPKKAASFSLIAFDPNAPAGDQVVKEVLEALKNRWATYVNTFAGTPVLVVRAILLDALAQAAASDDRIGVAFVTSARNALPFMEVGDEKTIWADIVAQVENKIDARAEREWATPESIAVPRLSFETPAAAAPRVSSAKVDQERLVAQFQAAAGPQSANAATNGNPHWPTANGPWVAEFGTRMAQVVADIVDASAAKIAISGIDVSEPLNQLATAVTGYVEGTLTAFSGATAGLQRRTGLLWWKEALYSPSARVSYRDLAPEAAAALMALDLHNQIPTFSPASVAAFLHEAVVLLPLPGGAANCSIGDLATMARRSPELAPLRTAAAGLFSAPQGRGPLLALIGYPHTPASLSGNEFRDLIGIAADTPLTFPAWAIWLFRELQAARASAEGAKAKRQPRKSQAQ